MSTLAQELDRYLKIRRSMGYSLTTTARSLRKFVEFARKERAEHITTDLFLRWQKDFGHAHRITWAKRLAMVRNFAIWLRGIDSRHEVPPRALIPCRYSRRTPHIYRQQDIQRIITRHVQVTLDPRFSWFDLCNSFWIGRGHRNAHQ